MSTRLVVSVIWMNGIIFLLRSSSRLVVSCFQPTTIINRRSVSTTKIAAAVVASSSSTATTATTSSCLRMMQSKTTGSGSDDDDKNKKYWNRETSSKQDFDPKAPVLKTAKVIALSDPNDPANAPLYNLNNINSNNNSNNNHVQLLKIGETLQDFGDDMDTLRSLEPNVVFVSSATARQPLAQLLQELPSLEWVHTRSAGIDFCTSPSLERWEGQLTNAKGQFSSTLAEYTLMACAYFAKDLPRLMRSKRAKKWDKYPVLEMRGATLGIVGFGDIGHACARLAAIYGMRVVAVRRHPNPDPLCDKVYGNDKASLNRLFAESDYILCSAPLTPETCGLIGKEQFDSAKKDAVFINVGRGPVVDQDALIESLQNGRLKGAALDVMEPEPLPQDSPLWEMDNVLLSPHNMDMTATFMLEATEFFVQENLPRFVRGLDLLNQADKVAGY